MKRMLLLAGTIATCGLVAQPTLTFPFNTSILESDPTLNIGGDMDEGPPGENQIWDFSEGSFPQQVSTDIVLTSETPYAADFPDTDIAVVAGEQAGTSYTFINFESDGVYTAGLAGDLGILGELVQTYSDQRRDIAFSMTLGTSYSDSVYFSSESFGLITESASDYMVEVDGYGTLITPDATYNNVLRVHTVEDTESVIDIGIGPPIVNLSSIESYGWLIDGYPNPIMLTFTQTTEGGAQSGSRYIGGLALLTSEFNTLDGVSLYPVPAKDFVNLDMGDHQVGKSTIRIFDIRGSVIQEFNRTIDQVTRFEISDLPSGFYSFQVQTEEGLATKHFTK